MATIRRSWPLPANDTGTAALASQLAARTRGDPRAAALLHADDTKAAIAAIGGNSPYLADLAAREWETTLLLAADGPDPVVASALASLDATDPAIPGPALRRALRVGKRRVALATAWGDLGGTYPLETVTGSLSRFAEAALRLACDHLLLEAERAGRLPARLLARTRPIARGSGLVVLGMGKLGGGELNYSSDIDLVILYDGDHHALREADRRGGAPAAFARLARDLVSLIGARDDDGYVFRTDLRLRPDPGFTAPALSVGGAVAYYESLAQPWERAALSKARPVAGDLARGRAFLNTISPFVWRRGLDFAAIDDMRAMKARIDRAHGPGPPPGASGPDLLLGHDLKRGRGGIREIEFVAQTMQLVWGGRDKGLRERSTLAALDALAVAGHLDAADAAALARAYRVLRGIEHRLQMVDDRQTHALPTARAGFERFARFAGVADGTALARVVADALGPTEAIFRALLGSGTTQAGGDAAEAEAVGADPDALAARGFARPAEAATLLRRWRDGEVRALRSARARALLEETLPTLLSALGRVRDPDASLARFGQLLDRLAGGVPTLSLLARNPGLVARLASLLGASPPLADRLASQPDALEGLLAPFAIDPHPKRTLARLLAGRPDADPLETAIETARRFGAAEQFRLGAAELDGSLDTGRAGRARTVLADATIALLLDRVGRAHRARHGTVDGGGLVVVALGRAGSRAMMAGSDLDLLLIYDHAPDAGASGGSGVRPLAPSQYYGRLAQALVAALTAPGRDGPLYACDMRLRPSGRAGPVAVSLSSFGRYHRAESWTWERMALTRARVVAGPPALGRRVAAAIAAALDRRAGTDALADAASMRRRLARDRPAVGPFDVRLRPGGLMELEFIAQVKQLGPAPGFRRSTGTGTALARLGAAGRLPVADARALIGADRFWRTLQSRLRLLAGSVPPAGALPLPVRDGLRTLFGEEVDVAATAEQHAAIVRDCFERNVGPAGPA